MFSVRVRPTPRLYVWSLLSAWVLFGGVSLLDQDDLASITAVPAVLEQALEPDLDETKFKDTGVAFPGGTIPIWSHLLTVSTDHVPAQYHLIILPSSSRYQQISTYRI